MVWFFKKLRKIKINISDINSILEVILEHNSYDRMYSEFKSTLSYDSRRILEYYNVLESELDSKLKNLSLDFFSLIKFDNLSTKEFILRIEQLQLFFSDNVDFFESEFLVLKSKLNNKRSVINFFKKFLSMDVWFSRFYQRFNRNSFYDSVLKMIYLYDDYLSSLDKKNKLISIKKSLTLDLAFFESKLESYEKRLDLFSSSKFDDIKLKIERVFELNLDIKFLNDIYRKKFESIESLDKDLRLDFLNNFVKFFVSHKDKILSLDFIDDVLKLELEKKYSFFKDLYDEKLALDEELNSNSSYLSLREIMFSISECESEIIRLKAELDSLALAFDNLSIVARRDKFISYVKHLDSTIVIESD